MEKYFYETTIVPSDFFDTFCDFVMELGIEAIEIKDNSIIVRTEEEPVNMEWGVKEFSQKLSASLNRPINFKISTLKKKNEDWIKKYKESITPIEIGRFYIHPTWLPLKKDKINIKIDPALSFGTGHHESTYSCLELIEKTVQKNDTFLDVGCGSGILSIAARKLGAEVSLCDTDTLSIESAKKNFKLNNEKYRDIWIGSANMTNNVYDTVVANIVTDVLIIINKDLKKRLMPEGNLILSGILDIYLDKVLLKFQDFKIIDIIKKGEWRTLHLKKVKNGKR